MAVQQYDEVLQYASYELRSNKEFILTVLQQNGIACEYSLLKDYQNFDEIVEKDGENFCFLAGIIKM